ncbi:putative phenol 2-monooxygenase [Corynespora cassiicola Philippines]|uniref:Putative phenol 2-monooxygenase n=1 Tax=Corynespora cassiicola Philippines TaxID=1448308 RepID=A0A2T2NFK3_CORCC|nr:putative phenol 2-monooxygenase [Corynespora cassiicola Philippines]
MVSATDSTTDVLIIGAGPSGLTAALWMARLGVNARVIDAQPTKWFRGKADSLQIRSMEILASFGIVDPILETGAPMFETNYWGDDGKGGIKRMMRAPEWYPELGRFYQTNVVQGDLERTLMDGMKRFNNLEVERGVQATEIKLDDSSADDPEAYPITVTVKHLTEAEMAEATDDHKGSIPKPGDFNWDPRDEPYRIRRPSGKEGTTEIIRAKYLIGTDGPRSIVRKSIGANSATAPREPGGVALDFVAETNFPDILTRSIVVRDGRFFMILPREKGLIRIGFTVDELKDRDSLKLEEMLATIQKGFYPYEVKLKKVDWFGVFKSFQRMATKLSEKERIFLAGDALHTHSPKAGIGMNFSLQDTYDLGWKIAHVVKGLAKRKILQSYAEERGLICRQLVEFDRNFSPTMVNNGALKTSHDAFVKSLPFVSCTGIEYEDGTLVAKSISKQHLAPKALVGRRLLTKWVRGHISGMPVDLERRLTSDGRYKLLVFAGDVADANSLERVRKLSQVLEQPTSFLQRTARNGFQREDFFDILTIHTSSRDGIEVSDLPQFLVQIVSKGLRVDQVFIDNPESNGFMRSDAYEGYGIDRLSGCIILLRPDRHIMYIGELEDGNKVEELMSGILAE